MAGDKLNRVKSVRKWLDKAEQSYSRDKEIITADASRIFFLFNIIV